MKTYGALVLATFGIWIALMQQALADGDLCGCALTTVTEYKFGTSSRQAFAELKPSVLSIYKTRTITRKVEELDLWHATYLDSAAAPPGTNYTNYAQYVSTVDTTEGWYFFKYTGSTNDAARMISASGSSTDTMTINNIYDKLWGDYLKALGTMMCLLIEEDGITEEEQADWDYYYGLTQLNPINPTVNGWPRTYNYTNGTAYWSGEEFNPGSWYAWNLGGQTILTNHVTNTLGFSKKYGTYQPFDTNNLAYTQAWGNPGSTTVTTNLSSAFTQTEIWPLVTNAMTNASGPTAITNGAYAEITAGGGIIDASRQDMSMAIKATAPPEFPKDAVVVIKWIEQITVSQNGIVVSKTDKPDQIPVVFDGFGVFVTNMIFKAGTDLVAILNPTNGSTSATATFSRQIIDGPRLVRLDCPTCGDKLPLASLSLGNNSVDAKFTLGKTASGEGVGVLQLHAEKPSTNLSTPAALSLISLPGRVLVTTNGSGVMTQLEGDQLRGVISVSNAYRYQIQFFAKTNASMTNLTNVLVSYVIENPDTSGTTSNQLNVIEVRGSGTVTNSYVWSHTDQGWDLITGNGLRSERKVTSWNPGTSIRTETRYIRTPGSGAETYQVTSKHQLFAWGEGLIEETEGTGTAARTTTYTYHDSGRQRTVTSPDGSWHYTEYDSIGRVTRTLSGIKNQTFTTTGSAGREISYSYAPIEEAGDDGSVKGDLARMQVEKMLGQEVGRTYMIYLTNEVRSINCVTPGAAWDAMDNLVTVTEYVSDGDFQGKPARIFHADGTLSIFTYDIDEDGLRYFTEDRGVADEDDTSVVDGTRTIRVEGEFSRLLSTTTYDIASEIITDQRFYSEYDDTGRAGRVMFLDGKSQQFVYSCCNLDSEVDRDGTVTTYLYDALKRRRAVTRNGITTLTTYNAHNQAVANTRLGTDSSSMLLVTNVFDNAGRLTASIDALTNITSFAETTNAYGRLVRTTTYPDGGTRIETHYLDGSIETVTGTAVYGERNDVGIEIVDEVYRAYTKSIKLQTNGSDSGEWIKTYSDMLGSPIKQVYPDDAVETWHYNSKHQLWKTVDPDGVKRLFAYNALGEQEYTAIDMNQNDTIDLAGTDRVTRSVRSVAASSGVNVHRQQTYIWGTNSANTSLLVSTSESAVEGNRQWQFAFGLTNYSIRVCLTNGQCWSTNVAPDGSYIVSFITNGLPYTTTRYDAIGSQLSQTTFGYDTHGRRTTVTDARNGTTTFTFNLADRVLTTTTPVPASAQSAQVISMTYDSMGRVIQTTQPDSAVVYNQYFANGNLKKTYGSRTYPVEYTYDYAGRMKTMKTWQNFANDSGAATTTWNYGSQRGFLSSKRYADNKGPDYTYTAAGRLASRVWARGITTTYSYNNGGDLSETAYDDGITPTVTVAYDRRGRRTSATQGSDVDSFLYTSAGQLSSESFSGGPLNNLTVTNSYDGLLRRSSLGLYASTSQRFHQTYGYDAASRLSTVSDGTNTAGYSHIENSPLVGQIAFTNSGTLRMTTTKSYDMLNRLTNTVSASASNTSSFAYIYNTANQRTRVTIANGSYWVYEYDSLGQVVSGKKYWADNTPVGNQSFDYAYDDIGNRKTAARDAKVSSYSANSLNQYTSRTVPGYQYLLGSAHSNSTVTVNLQPTYRKSEYFWKALPVNNTTGAVWQALHIVGVLNQGTNADIVTTNAGYALMPKTPEAFIYDDDGNTLTDGQWQYTWDGENRLIRIESLTTTPSAARMKEEWKHLSDGRWSQRIVSQWNGFSYVAQYTNRFVWDGKVLMAIMDGNNTVQVGLLRGSDLSGSIQGAGGVGGVLALNLATNGTHFMTYDGNGNVTGLVSASTGEETARYEYDPFGQTLRATGSMAMFNPVRFSTQYADDVTGRIKYLYRDYDPDKGRWLSRDPIGEGPGNSPYAYIGNSPTIFVDRFGLVLVRPPSENWDQTFEIQKPLPDGVIGHTTVSYSIKIESVDVSGTGKNCCCKLKSASYHTKIVTRYSPKASAGTFMHEGAHAAVDYILGNAMLPKAIDCMKSRFAVNGAISEQACRKKLEQEAEAVAAFLKGLADGMLQNHHHLFIGENGTKYTLEGEESFQKWFEGWMSAWQDDISKTGDCKFW